jgi:hypothetical protein
MKYLIAILLFAATALAQNNSGTLVIAPIRPQASNDTFPSAIANEIQGGPFSVSTLTAMSNIPSGRLVSGATAYVTNDAGLRLWNGTNWSAGNFRTAIGLGATSDVAFNTLTVGSASITFGQTPEGGIAIGGQGTFNLVTVTDIGMSLNRSNYGYSFGTNNPEGAGITRTNLGLGATNEVFFQRIQVGGNVISTNTFTGNEFDLIAGGRFGFGIGQGQLSWMDLETNSRTIRVYSDNNNVISFLSNKVSVAGDIVISNEAANNGLLFIYRTNNEPFLGLANLIASNNTTISNETLFRVGVAEATNKAAQFGFRSTNTNGDGVAVFSTFGYNALMMVGPSARSATNASVEADIYSISPTNRVATLIDTNTGAFTFHRSIGFDTNVSSVGNTNLVPATNNQIQKWLRVYIGTNTFYLPLYQ